MDWGGTGSDWGGNRIRLGGKRVGLGKNEVGLGRNEVGLRGNGVGLDGERGRTGWKMGSDWGKRSRTGGLVFMKSDILIYA